MGNGKISPLIIVVLMIVLAGVAFVAIRIMSGESALPIVGDDSKDEEQVSGSTPVVTLELSSEEKDQDQVTIYVKANVKTENEEENGIESITLPDGTIVTADEAEFVVTENGTYTFKVTSVEGVQSTSDIKVENIRLVSADNPYIPEGFEYVGGDVEKGYTISDQYGNEYVWVPCAKGILTRDRLLDSNYEETSDSASELVNSVAKYYGFYIGRYEASAYDTGNGLVASTREGEVPWTDITYLDAATASKVSAEYFGYEEEIKTNIMNSYAWDTTLEWLNTSVDETAKAAYSSSINHGNYSGTIKPTGTTSTDKVNNICDMAGNVREWTSEILKSEETKKKGSSKKVTADTTVRTRIVRGGSANLSKTATGYTAYNEDTSEPYWGFRIILYKM